MPRTTISGLAAEFEVETPVIREALGITGPPDDHAPVAYFGIDADDVREVLRNFFHENEAGNDCE